MIENFIRTRTHDNPFVNVHKHSHVQTLARTRSQLPLERTCNVTIEDFEDMTKDITDFEDGEKVVDLAAFDALMRKELRAYAQRALANSIRKTTDNDSQVLLSAIKMMLVCILQRGLRTFCLFHLCDCH